MIPQANHAFLHRGEVAASGLIVGQVSFGVHWVMPATSTQLVDNGGRYKRSAGGLRIDD